MGYHDFYALDLHRRTPEARATNFQTAVDDVFRSRHSGCMPNALEQITKEALQLSKQQRLALAGFLLELDEVSDDPQADAAWAQEIRARIQAVDAGTAVGIPYEEAMRQAQDRLRP